MRGSEPRPGVSWGDCSPGLDPPLVGNPTPASCDTSSFGAGGRIRTHNIPGRSWALYPIELRRPGVARDVGVSASAEFQATALALPPTPAATMQSEVSPVNPDSACRSLRAFRLRVWTALPGARGLCVRSGLCVLCVLCGLCGLCVLDGLSGFVFAAQISSGGCRGRGGEFRTMAGGSARPAMRPGGRRAP